MSVENVGAFFTKAAKDKELRDQVKSVDSEKDFFALGKSAGFEISEEDWNKVYLIGGAAVVEEIRSKEPHSDPEGIQNSAKERGFFISTSVIEVLNKEFDKAEGKEALSESDLAGVSGGCSIGAWFEAEGSGGAGAFLDSISGTDNDNLGESTAAFTMWAVTPTSVGVATTLYDHRNDHSWGGYGGL